MFMDSNVTSIWSKKLEKQPVKYTVEFIHDKDGFHFIVHDVQNSEHDRISVAKDLQAASNSLQDNATPN